FARIFLTGSLRQAHGFPKRSVCKINLFKYVAYKLTILKSGRLYRDRGINGKGIFVLRRGNNRLAAVQGIADLRALIFRMQGNQQPPGVGYRSTLYVEYMPRIVHLQG